MAERVRLKYPIKTERVRIVRKPDTAVRSPAPGGSSPDRAGHVKIVDRIELLPTNELRVPNRRLRNYPKSTIQELANSLETYGFLIPIVTDQSRLVWAGEPQLEAAKLLKLSHVPTVSADHLSEAVKRAFRLFDARFHEKGMWDRQGLALEFPELEPLLVAEGFDISITGFSPVEIDQIVLDMEENSADPADGFDASSLEQEPVSRKGDVYKLGDHVIACGDARDEALLRSLVVGNRKVAMAFLDPPYNVKIKNVVGRGKIKHAEFAMASGEQTSEEYINFLTEALAPAIAVSRDGALHYLCCDWGHLGELYQAAHRIYGAQVNLCVWVKSNGGQGSFYRSQHELIGVFRVGKGKYLNNIELGRNGRSRTNVWSYSGVNAFRAGRLDDLRAHPTTKPIAMVCDAIRDCTRRGDTVLDTFLGSGTTLLAAERVGRRAVGVEIEPRYVDLVIRRWQEFTGKDAIHIASGRTFRELAADRNSNTEAA